MPAPFNPKSVQSLTLDLPPSCIEFCPAYPDYFCVGTYNLEKDEVGAQGDLSRPQNRSGSIVVFRLEDKTIRQIAVVVQPSAVLDLHFHNFHGRQDLFAVASSTATLSIFRLTGLQTDVLEPFGIARISRVRGNVLFLACAWHPTIPDLIGVSTSEGKIYILGLDLHQNPCGVFSSQCLMEHDMEAWSLAFSPVPQVTSVWLGEEAGLDGTPQDDGDRCLASFVVYSGGDDSTLRYTSCRVCTELSPHGDLPLQVPYSPCRMASHRAGVTAILPVDLKIHDGKNIVLTGSYDDYIRVFAIADLAETAGAREEKCLAEENLGGGVWRLKLVWGRNAVTDGTGVGGCWSMRVLASCMHAGVCVVDIDGSDDGSCSVKVVARFGEHKSMNYGSDFQPCAPHIYVSTSFYDKLLCLWALDDTNDT